MTEMERELTKIIESQAHQINELLAKVATLQESLDYLTKKMYGKSSEKTQPGQLSLFENDQNFTKQIQLRNKPTK